MVVDGARGRANETREGKSSIPGPPGADRVPGRALRQGRRALSRKAVGAEACNADARRVLIDALGKLGLEAEAASRSRGRWSNGVSLVCGRPQSLRARYSCSATPSIVSAPRPDRTSRIRYFWKMKRDPGDGRSIGVFVHLVQRQDRKRRFHGEHRLLEKEDADDGRHPLRAGDLVIRDAWIRVPGDATPGAYRMLLGVYDLQTGQRWAAVVTETAARRDRVPLGILHVEAAGTP